MASVSPSGLEFQTKLRSTTTGVRFRTMMRGLPGMNLGHARDMYRACASVPPPGLKPTIMLIVFPLKYASASKAGSTGNGVAVGRTVGATVGAAVGAAVAGGAVAPGGSGVGVAVASIAIAVGVAVAAAGGAAVGSSPPQATRTAASMRLAAPSKAIFFIILNSRPS